MQFRPAAVAVFALEILYRAVKRRRKELYKKLAPELELTESGSVKRLENFGDYVVRQLGLSADNAHIWLSELANKYLRGNRSDSEGGEEHIFAYLNGVCSEEEIESLYTELVQEFNACTISYFAFHWGHSSFIIDQALGGNCQPKKRLQLAAFSATRKQRFEKVQRSLSTKNAFFTLLEQLKAVGHYAPLSDQNKVAVPPNVNARSPVLLLVGGGMGAGKSSVVRNILEGSFWSDAAKNAVVVEADAFKETDLIYRALSSSGHWDMLETAEFVHKASTDAASSVLVAALNEGRDIIFDGTMSWEPYVKQTIAMVRDIHHRRYRMGPGYGRGSDGTVYEKYWEPIEENDSSEEVCTRDCAVQGMKQGIFSEEVTDIKEMLTESGQSRKPYRIELIGVICDASFAVVRGIRRAILTKRAVRIRQQLSSHKMFASAFYTYCELVDHANLYCTNRIGGPAELIWSKELDSKLQVDPEDGTTLLTKLSLLNPNAKSILELYNMQSDGNELVKEWKSIVLSSERNSCQQLLRGRIQRIEFLAKTNADLAGNNGTDMVTETIKL